MARRPPPLGRETPRTRAGRMLREWLDQGVISTGAILPGEEELAAKAEVSRFTLHQALLTLATEGRLRPHGKRGWVTTSDAVPGLGTLLLVSDHGTVPHRFRGETEFNIHFGVLDGAVRAGLNVGICPAADFIGRVTHGALPAMVVLLLDAARDAAVAVTAERLAARGVAVAAQADHDGLLPWADAVQSDHLAGSRDLAAWLIGRGRRRILRLWERLPGGARWPWMLARDAGFLAAHAAAGMEPLPALEYPNPTLGDAREEFDMRVRLVESLLRDHSAAHGEPDAVMGTTDRSALVASAALRRCGRDPVEAVPVAGYDAMWTDSPELSWEPTLPVATVDKGNLTMGARLVELALARARGLAPAQAQRVVVPPEVVVLRDIPVR